MVQIKLLIGDKYETYNNGGSELVHCCMVDLLIPVMDFTGSNLKL